MLHAEYQANLIDGLQSASIGVAILILQSIPLDSILGFLHYTGDFCKHLDPMLLHRNIFRTDGALGCSHAVGGLNRVFNGRTDIVQLDDLCTAGKEALQIV